MNSRINTDSLAFLVSDCARLIRAAFERRILVAGSASALTFSALPLLLVVSFVGFITADLILISIIGAGAVRRFYRAHERLIVRCSGVLFMGFAAQALWHATPGLLGWRRA